MGLGGHYIRILYPLLETVGRCLAASVKNVYLILICHGTNQCRRTANSWQGTKNLECVRISCALREDVKMLI